jgi:hypothetical protein
MIDVWTNQRQLIMLSNNSAIWFSSTDHGIKILEGEGSITSGDVLSLILPTALDRTR